MNKRVLSIALALGLLVSTAPVMADEAAQNNNSTQVVEQQQQTSQFINFETTVKSFEGLLETVNQKDETINFNITDETLIFDSEGNKKTKEDLTKDVKIKAFVYANAPALAIFPPQYTPKVVIITDETKPNNVDVDTYVESEIFGDVTNKQNMIALNIADTTVIENEKGEKVEKDTLAGNDLVVFYSIMTMSIPGQTTPSKIVVLDKQDDIEDQTQDTKIDMSSIKKINVKDNTIDYTSVTVDGKYLVPLRDICEGLGLKVEWSNELQSVLINNIYGLKIGNKEYIKGKMAPIQLEQAPALIVNDNTGVTYVPVEFFTDVMECTASVDGDTLILK